MAASYSQFGAGQLVDRYSREYRVVRRQNVHVDDPLPFDLSVHDVPDVLLQVRIRKRSRQKRLELLRDASQRKRLEFPQVGERIVIRETQRIMALQGLRAEMARSTTIQVKRVAPRSQNALTAALIVSVS